MNEIFALVDCNNFYVSCERVFNPAMQDRPVIVLSNNDGCVVSRSNEAKVLGVQMGIAAFKIKDIIERNNVEVFSSNYALYADMSGRVMQTLAQFTPAIEVYSIDEAFLDITGLNSSLTEYGRKIKETVQKWTGIPVSIGIASTKTLAKLAQKISKKSDYGGVFDLTDPAIIDDVLKTVEVEKVWGIGIKSTIKLKRAGIHTAYDLKCADTGWIQKIFGIGTVKTVYELRNIKCFNLDENPSARQSVVVSRSFGKPVETTDELLEAVSAFAARAGEKLREEKLFANCITVFVMTNRFDPANRYFNCRTVQFGQATSYTPNLINSACEIARTLYRPNSRFKKAGVILTGLVGEDNIQLNLFDTLDRKKVQRLMDTVDRINNLFPQASLHWAAEGIGQDWQVQFLRRSPRYTTRWDELLQIA